MFERTNTGIKGTLIRAIMVGMNRHISSIIVCYLNGSFNFFLRLKMLSRRTKYTSLGVTLPSAS